jgi:hypothetical protein
MVEPKVLVALVVVLMEHITHYLTVAQLTLEAAVVVKTERHIKAVTEAQVL